MSRNLKMVEDQLNKGEAPASVFGRATADRSKPSEQEMPKQYAPANVTPIRPLKPGETVSMDFNLKALQENAQEQKTK